MKKFDFTDVKYTPPCHWDESRECRYDGDCIRCKYQPADDDKYNGKAPPRKVAWRRDEDGVFPVCPGCDEYAATKDRCFFCGQKFDQEDPKWIEWNKPPQEVREDCIVCGGKNTMVGVRAKSNGHFHGRCEKCGARIIE